MHVSYLASVHRTALELPPLRTATALVPFSRRPLQSKLERNTVPLQSKLGRKTVTDGGPVTATGNGANFLSPPATRSSESLFSVHWPVVTSRGPVAVTGNELLLPFPKNRVAKMQSERSTKTRTGQHYPFFRWYSDAFHSTSGKWHYSTWERTPLSVNKTCGSWHLRKCMGADLPPSPSPAFHRSSMQEKRWKIREADGARRCWRWPAQRRRVDRGQDGVRTSRLSQRRGDRSRKQGRGRSP